MGHTDYVGRDWPTLYKQDKNGRMRCWEISVEGNEIITSAGLMGGEMTDSPRMAKLRRYTPEEEAQAQFDKQRRLGWFETPAEAEQPQYGVMKAQTYKPEKHDVIGAYIQPKLDGLRCMAKRVGDKIILTSRGNKPWVGLEHIERDLMEVMDDGDMFDGELYIHGVEFNKISSWVRGGHPERVKVQYHVYDMPMNRLSDNWDQVTRMGHLYERMHRIDLMFSCLVLVDTQLIVSEESLQALHEAYVELGYEGSMIRFPGGKYEYGQRSSSLLKYKDWHDDEFEIVDVKEGRGKAQGQAIFVCDNKFGLTFDSVITGDDAYRSRLYRERKSLIGKLLTVKYQNLSPDRIPRFPVGLKIRERGE